jgi:hypothetical protein
MQIVHKVLVVALLVTSLSSPTASFSEPAGPILELGASEVFLRLGSGSNERVFSTQLSGYSGSFTDWRDLDPKDSCLVIETKAKNEINWVPSEQQWQRVRGTPGGLTLTVEFSAVTSNEYSARLRTVCDFRFTPESSMTEFTINSEQESVTSDSVPDKDFARFNVYRFGTGDSWKSLSISHPNPKVICWVMAPQNSTFETWEVGGWFHNSAVGWNAKCQPNSFIVPEAAKPLEDWLKPHIFGLVKIFPSDGKYVLTSGLILDMQRKSFKSTGEGSAYNFIGRQPSLRSPASVEKVSWKAGSNFANLSWLPVRDPGSGPLMGYVVTQSNSQNVKTREWVVGPTARTLKVSASAGVFHYYSIRAFSKFSPSSDFRFSYTLPSKPFFVSDPILTQARVSLEPKVNFEINSEPSASFGIVWYLCKENTLQALTLKNIAARCLLHKSDPKKPSPLGKSATSLFLVAAVSAKNKLGTVTRLSDHTLVTNFFSGNISVSQPIDIGGSYSANLQNATLAKASPRLTFQWFSCSTAVSAENIKDIARSCVSIKSATNKSFIPGSITLGHILVKVTATSKMFGQSHLYSSTVSLG